MKDDQMDDLKQFITTTVSQQLADTEKRLTEEMRQGFAGVSEAIEGINQHQAEQDTRLDKLESVQA